MDHNNENITTSDSKRKSIGTISIQKVANQKDWKTYAEATAKFAEAKSASQVAKQRVKELLKKHVPSLKNVAQLDFYIQAGNLSIFEVSKAPRKSRASSQLDFRE